ncbi:MAG: hypothetical protein SFW62_04550, partial [Alphaproteobacteria bacterium]|nr:hypothetical protein [Alphaproteobacteria bacterium]
MSREAVDLYGDIAIQTTGLHGYNISEQRMDELDQTCLDFVSSRTALKQPCQALDIGGGSGAQSKRMAASGASVLFVDLTDQQQSIEDFNAKTGHESIRFIQRDIRKIAADEWPS